ncbi:MULTISPECIES: hypothetical protein [Bacillaceae]|uniref:Uncharacterized protein n=1 Tax=Evansella alkalicola TaxID=745819 RepID=A0ABS6JSE3_9BACI|nr:MULTISPECIES: hypothetical protein [Bacillaceae]MBU9721345.1 hypothetical protein [Bacillus alkalicola]
MKKAFSITVSTQPNTNLSIAKDISLVKVGLVYADNVKLASPGVSMIASLDKMSEMSEKYQAYFYREMMRQSDETLFHLMDRYYKILSKRVLSKQEIALRKKYRQGFVITKPKVEEIANKIIYDSGFEQIKNIIENGVLELETYTPNDGNYFEQVLNEFMESVTSSALEGNTYPLYDQHVSKLIGSFFGMGLIKNYRSTTEKMKHTGFTADTMQRLPCFEKATIGEVLDIRKELNRELIRFRSAMFKYSKNINNEQWSDDFLYEVERLYREEVEPAVLEIEEQCESNIYLKELSYRVATSKLTVPSLFGMAVSPTAEFIGLTETMIATVLSISTEAVKTYKDYRDKASTINGNQMFFYYQAGKILQK